MTLDALVERTIGALWRSILAAIDAVQGRDITGVLSRVLLARNIQDALDAVDLTEFQNAVANLQRQLGPVREAAFDLARLDLPKRLQADQLVRVNMARVLMDHPDRARAIAAQDLSRIQGVTAETREALREIIARGLQQGTHPTTLAREIRGLIGLNRQQAKAVANYRARLLSDGVKRPPARIERMVERYARKKLRERSETIARTETLRAAGEGRRLQWERLVRDGALDSSEWEQEFLTAHDERTCPVCSPMDGQRRDIGQPFQASTGLFYAPPIHPNCVVGDTLVTASPNIRAASAREYRGPICVIVTAGGKELRCTPNHPILTDGGWLPASALNVGDDVVCHRLDERESLRGDHDDVRVPAMIEEVAEALRGSRGVAAAEVPVSPPDFHGDGEGSEVAVVWADLLLGNRAKPTIGKPAFQPHLGVGTVESSLLPGPCRREQSAHGDRATTDGGVRIGGHGQSVPAVHAGVSESRGVGLTAWREALLLQAVHDDAAGGVERGGNGIDGLTGQESCDHFTTIDPSPFLTAQATPGMVESAPHSASGNTEGLRDRSRPLSGVEPASDVGFVEVQAWAANSSRGAARSDANLGHRAPDSFPADAELVADLLEAHTLTVERDRVVRVDRLLLWHGTVFNLETEGGWFAANGIITHNCRCTVRLIMRGFRAGQPTAPARDAILRRIGRLGG